jgi:hypothetical protein
MRIALAWFCLAAPILGQTQLITVDASAPAAPFPHSLEQMLGPGRTILSLCYTYQNGLRAVKNVTDFRLVRFSNEGKHLSAKLVWQIHCPRNAETCRRAFMRESRLSFTRPYPIQARVNRSLSRRRDNAHIAGMKVERDTFGFAGSKLNALQSLKGKVRRTGQGGRRKIQLNHLNASLPASVCYGNIGFQRVSGVD